MKNSPLQTLNYWKNQIDNGNVTGAYNYLSFTSLCPYQILSKTGFKNADDSFSGLLT